MGGLITITAHAAVATRIAAAIALDSCSCVSEHLMEYALVFQLRHQPSATGTLWCNTIADSRGLLPPVIVTSRSVSGTSNVSVAPSRTA